MDGNQAPDRRGACAHIHALRESMQQEWLRFQRRQEELFERCLEDVTSGAEVKKDVFNSDVGPEIVSLYNMPSFTPSLAARSRGMHSSDDQAASVRDEIKLALLPIENTVSRMEVLMIKQDGLISASPLSRLDQLLGKKPRAFNGKMEEFKRNISSQSLSSTESTRLSREPSARLSREPGDPSEVEPAINDSVSPHHSPGKEEWMMTAADMAQQEILSPAKISYKELAESSKQWQSERSVVHRNLVKHFSGCLDWWTSLQEPERTGRLATFVNGKPFELTCASVIIINAALSCVQINHEISTLDTEPTPFMAVAEVIFVIFYTVELILKLIVHRQYYFCNEDWRWNIFDAVLVTFSLFETIGTVVMATAEEGGSSFTFMRTLRILKMARVLRGLRVMRFFYELRLMLNSLIGSLSSLFWSIAMLGLIFYIFGLVFVQGVANFLLDEGIQDPALNPHARLMDEFGRVERAVLSLYMAVTGGDEWVVFMEALAPMPRVYQFIFIFFIAFSQIALLNILTAIFVQRAMKLAQPDRETQAMELRNNEVCEYSELHRIIFEADTNSNGLISLKEFCDQVGKGKLGAQLSVLGLNIREPKTFFRLIQRELGASEIPLAILVEKCMGLRGQATSIDIQLLGSNICKVERSQREFQSYCMDYLQAIASGVQLSMATQLKEQQQADDSTADCDSSTDHVHI